MKLWNRSERAGWARCIARSKQRFEREAKAISSLNHPNICVLYDVGNQDGTEYLVMECSLQNFSPIFALTKHWAMGSI